MARDTEVKMVVRKVKRKNDIVKLYDSGPVIEMHSSKNVIHLYITDLDTDIYDTLHHVLLRECIAKEMFRVVRNEKARAIHARSLENRCTVVLYISKAHKQTKEFLADNSELVIQNRTCTEFLRKRGHGNKYRVSHHSISFDLVMDKSD